MNLNSRSLCRAVSAAPRFLLFCTLAAVLLFAAHSPAAKKKAEKPGTAAAGRASEELTPEEIIWNYLYEKIGNPYGTAGLMGNLYAESTLHSNNLQNSYERKLGMTDDEYTDAVDSGTYENFVRDAAGYGLAQWTFWSRKRRFSNSRGNGACRSAISKCSSITFGMS
ncbi:MAG: hypothetical protein IJG60_04180 [Thermoguttaceae bacterium]|nr:hypothetical protein [Thermoguttaceae bacterium]